MPITQDRMMSVIDAGLDYQNAIRRAEEFVREARNNVFIHKMDPIEQLDNLAILIDEMGLLTNPKISPVILQLERRHFKKTSAENSRRKKFSRAKKGYKGKIKTAPDSLIQMSSVQDETSRVSQLRIALKEKRETIINGDVGLSADMKEQILAEAAGIEEELRKEEAFLAAHPEIAQAAGRNMTPDEELDDLMSQGIGGTHMDK